MPCVFERVGAWAELQLQVCVVSGAPCRVQHSHTHTPPGTRTRHAAAANNAPAPLPPSPTHTHACLLYLPLPTTQCQEIAREAPAVVVALRWTVTLVDLLESDIA